MVQTNCKMGERLEHQSNKMYPVKYMVNTLGQGTQPDMTK